MFIDSKVRQQADDLRQEYEAATPFKHVVIDHFFEPSALAALMEEFPSLEESTGGDYGGKGVKTGTTGIRDFGPTFKEWDSFVASDTFRTLMEQITGIDDLIYDCDYVGAGVHENFEGYRSFVHIDYNYHPRTNFHRRFNLIVYTSESWDPKHGGGLILCEDGFHPDEGTVKHIECLYNRAIIFETTEHSWHGVESIIFPEGVEPKSRKSITVYMYTQDRPVHERAEFHETIYLPGPRPKCIAEGQQLSKLDVEDLEQYIESSRGLIQGLYRHHESMLARLRNQNSVMASFNRNYSLPVLGALKVDFDRSLSDPAGWIGTQFELRVCPFPGARQITFDGVPHIRLADDAEIRISVDGEERVIRPQGQAFSEKFETNLEVDCVIEVRIEHHGDEANPKRLLRIVGVSVA